MTLVDLYHYLQAWQPNALSLWVIPLSYSARIRTTYTTTRNTFYFEYFLINCCLLSRIFALHPFQSSSWVFFLYLWTSQTISHVIGSMLFHALPAAVDVKQGVMTIVGTHVLAYVTLSAFLADVVYVLTKHYYPTTALLPYITTTYLIVMGLLVGLHTSRFNLCLSRYHKAASRAKPQRL